MPIRGYLPSYCLPEVYWITAMQVSQLPYGNQLSCKVPYNVH